MNPRFWGAAYYFLFFSAVGLWFPFLNLHYQQNVGLGQQQIGLLAALSTLVTLIGSPIWSGLADRLNIHKRLLTLVLIVAPVEVVILVQARDFGVLIGLVSLQALLGAPISALADSAVLELLGEERHRYGSLRFWGSVGFGLTAFGGGFIIERWGINAAIAGYLVLMWLAAVVTTRLPTPQSVASPQLSDLAQILRDRRWILLVLALVLAGICASSLMNFFPLYMAQLGASTSWYGFTTLAMAVSELPVFFIAPVLIARGMARPLLMVSFVSFAMRALLASLTHDPWFAIVPQIAHGLCFAALWSASVAYARQIAPPGWSATAQSLLSVSFFGVGQGGGSLLCGWLYDTVGPVQMFQIASLFAIAALAVFMLSFRDPNSVTPVDPSPARPPA